MSNLWSDHIADLVPYVPGEQVKIDNLLKLNTNENPYGPSPMAIKAMREAASDDLRLYPEYKALELHQAIASLHKIKAEQVFLGNGSDEVLAHVFNAFFLRKNRPILLPDISYSFYKTYCNLYKIPHVYMPLDENFKINSKDYINSAKLNPCGIIFPNPNAPTGRLLTLAEIAAIAEKNPDTTVVIDEAYIDFGGQSAVSLINDFDNLLVIHTMSKSRSLAGLRVGYAMGNVDLIAALLRIKDSFNSYPIDSIAMAGAKAAIEDQQWFTDCCQNIIKNRQFLAEKLNLLGFNVIPSETNFLFASHTSYDAIKIAAKLRGYGILVRHFNAPRISNYLRITIGTKDQCQRLTDTLASIFKAGV